MSVVVVVDVVAVAVVVVLLFVHLVCFCLGVLVCSVIVWHVALGHACRMPPTGANIAVLVLKTKLAAD